MVIDRPHVPWVRSICMEVNPPYAQREKTCTIDLTLCTQTVATVQPSAAGSGA